MTKPENSRELRRLGRSELLVSPVGLGCLQFSSGKGISGFLWPPMDSAEVDAIVRVSIEEGVNWFDTAELYGWGESEKALSQALGESHARRDDVIIATKWWPLLRTAGSIQRTIGERLLNLCTDRIDLYQIHHPFSFSSIGSQMREMARLVSDGKVRYVGVSNFSAEQMGKAHRELSLLGLALVSNQVDYSLIKRDIETNGVLEAAEDLGVTIIAYSPLARGLLTGKFHDRPDLMGKRKFFRRLYSSLNRAKLESSRPIADALRLIGEKYDATPAQAAINWLVNFHGDSVVAIPGASSAAQAADNAGSMSFRLSKDDLEYLDEVSSPFKA